jgi:nucleotide-binding universal stress UspA family protein
MLRRRKMWEKILVTLDGSDLAELALPYAKELAIAFNSEVALLYVNEPAEQQYRRMHQLYIEDVAAQMKNGIKEVNPVVLDGTPAKEIIDYAEKNKIGLIVMASHGRSGIMPWAAGSVANKVLHTAKMPLLLVRATKPPKRPQGKPILNRVLLPLDGSEVGEAAVPYVQELMGRLGSEVILLGVVPPGKHIRTVGGLDYVLYPEQDLEQVKAEAREHLDKVYQQLKGKKGKVRVELRAGDIAREIIDYAKKTRASLIAISSHGHSGIAEWVFGSIAHKIVQTSKTPVLVVRATGEKA